MLYRPPELIALIENHQQTTDGLAHSMIPKRLKTGGGGHGADQASGGKAYQSQPPSPLKTMQTPSDTDDEKQKSVGAVDDVTTGGRGGEKGILHILMGIFKAVFFIVAIQQIIVTVISSKTLGQCTEDPGFDTTPGVFMMEHCFYRSMIPYLSLFVTIIGPNYVCMYGFWGPTMGWLVSIQTALMVFAWLLLGNLPPFTESLRGFCERHSEWATAGNSFCSDVVLAVLWIKIFVFTSLGGICVVIADRLRKVHGTREMIMFFVVFSWTFVCVLMLPLITPVVNDNRREDISIILIRFVYMPMGLIITDVGCRLLSRMCKHMKPGSTTLPTHSYRVMFACLVRIILLRLDSVGPIIMINLAIVLKDVAAKVGLRDPMIYLFRFSHGDEKSELALTTRTVRRQRVIEQISSMIADYSALMLILTLIIFGKQIDKDGNLMPVETHLSTFGALIGTQVIADIVTVLIDTKVHKFDYVGGLRNYYDSKVWIAHLIILLSYIPTNLMAFLSTFCFDTLEGGPGFGMKYKSDCPMLVYNYSKWYLHLGP